MIKNEERQHISIDESIYNLEPEWTMTNDLVFKYIFGRDTPESKILLMDLINTVLQLKKPKQITEIIYKNPFNIQESVDDKLSVMDIKATTGEGSQFNVEMQVDRQNDYVARSLLYWSALYSEPIGKGEAYEMLNRTIGIHFLNHQLFKHKPKPHLICNIYSQDYELITDLLEMHYIQMPLIGDIIKDEKDLYDWITMMKDISNPNKQEVIEEIVNGKEVMQMALTQFEKATADDLLREKMEAQIKYERDVKSRLRTAHEEGIEHGQLMSAKNMIKMNCSIEMIVEVTQLDEAQIKSLMKT